MNYFFYPLGAEEGEPNASELASDCVNNLKGYDYGSAEGRRSANREAGRCAAEAVCAYFSKGAMPSGICGPIGAKVADIVADVVESIAEFFGGGDEERRRQRLIAGINKQVKTEFLVAGYNAMMQSIVDQAQVALIQAWDATVPNQAGKLGGPAASNPHRLTWDMSYPVFDQDGKLIREEPVFDKPLSWVRYASMAPAGYLLRDMGADLDLAPICSFEVVPYTLTGCSSSRQIWSGPLLSGPEAFQSRAGVMTSGELSAFRAYARTGMEAFFPKWLKGMQEATAKATAFVTASATREQARELAMQNEKQLIAAQLTGTQKSNVLNWVLFLAGATALGGVYYATHGGRR